jgi:predicted nucleic acid-binding protein
MVISKLLSLITCIPLEESGSLQAPAFRHGVHDFAPKDPQKCRKATMTAIGFGDNDLWIASVALQHTLILVSSDSDFQRMQEVQSLAIESWV